MSHHIVQISAIIAACVVGGSYPLIIAKTMRHEAAGETADATIGGGFCLLYSIAFGLFLSVAIFA